MFIVHYVSASLGSDHNIGENETTHKLPETIKTLKEAADYVVKSSACGEMYDLEDMAKVTIYEVANIAEFDLEDFKRQAKLEAEIKKQKIQDDKDAAEFERLKKKFN